MSTLHCETIGAGPAVAMIHGWGLHGGVWRELAAALASRARVSMPDLPGHGRSQGHVPAALDDWVRAVAGCLGDSRAVWIGWSLGALVALRAATLLPNAVRALVLIAATPRFVQADDWPHAVTPALLKQFAAELGADYRRTLSRFIALQFGSSTAEREAARVLRETMTRQPPTEAGLRAGLEILEQTDLRGSLEKLDAPLLVINGERDRLVPAPAGEFLVSRVTHGRCALVAAAGHAPFLSHAPEVQRHVTGFVDEHARQ